MSTDDSFEGFSRSDSLKSDYQPPHRQRLLMFRYSRINRDNNRSNPSMQRYDSYVQQPHSSSAHYGSSSSPSASSQTALLRGSASESLDTYSPFHNQHFPRYDHQQTGDDHSIDGSEGSNLTTTTTITTGT